MTILTLDLGTKTGWALLHENSIKSGSKNFSGNRFSGGGMRFMLFRNWLDSLQLYSLKAVYFEEVRRHLGVDAAHVYGGFLAHLTAWAEAQNIPYRGVAVGTIKKFICGKGNAGKDEVISAVKAKGFNPVDDNESDAIALMLLATNKKYF